MKFRIFLKGRLTFSAVVFFFILLSFSTSLIAGQVVNSTYGEYYVSVPPTSSPAPVLVFLHGMGNDQNQGRRIFDAYTNQANMVLISPTGGSPNKSWMMGSGPSVRGRVEEVLAKYPNADRNNIFLVGYSAGGGVAYAFGPADSSFYQGMCIVNAPYQPGIISLQGKLPVYLLECEGDPNKVGAEMAKRYMESAGFDVDYDVIPASSGGTSHAYPTSIASPMIIKWIQSSLTTASGNSANDSDSYSSSNPAPYSSNDSDSAATSGSSDVDGTSSYSGATNNTNSESTANLDNDSDSGNTSGSNIASAPNMSDSNNIANPGDTSPSGITFETKTNSGISIVGQVLGLLILLFTTVILLILIVKTAPTQITLLIKKVFK